MSRDTLVGTTLAGYSIKDMVGEGGTSAVYRADHPQHGVVALKVLREKLRRQNLPEEAYWWYLELRKYGSAPHAGFGLGLVRMLMYVTGMKNIRDVIPMPRTPGSADFCVMFEHPAPR